MTAESPTAGSVRPPRSGLALALAASVLAAPAFASAELLASAVETVPSEVNEAQLALDSELFANGPFAATSLVEEGSIVELEFDTTTRTLSVVDLTLFGSDALFPVSGGSVESVSATGITVTLSPSGGGSVSVAESGVLEQSLELELDLSALLVVERSDGPVARQFDVTGIPFATTSGSFRAKQPSGAFELRVAGDIVETFFDVPGLGSVELSVSGGVQLDLAERVFLDGFESGDAGAWDTQVPAAR